MSEQDKSSHLLQGEFIPAAKSEMDDGIFGEINKEIDSIIEGVKADENAIEGDFTVLQPSMLDAPQ